MKKIEKNKKLRKKQKCREAKNRLVIQRTTESREFKRKIKSSIVHVPENTLDNFVDPNLEEYNEDNKTVKEETNFEEKHVDKKQKFDPEGFTILGVDQFARKNKVSYTLIMDLYDRINKNSFSTKYFDSVICINTFYVSKK